MAHSKEELWDLVNPVVQSVGLVLFDIEVPGRDGGVFRVFIDRNPGVPTVKLDVSVPAGSEDLADLEGADLDVSASADSETEDSEAVDNGRIGIRECVAVSHRLSALEGFDDLFDGAWTLEVSSPGMNRRLTRVEHFHGALGERVRVKGRLEDGTIRTVTGKLKEILPTEAIVVEGEEPGSNSTFPFGNIIEARVEFSFGKQSKKKN